ncbi:MAG: FkbM family methyltransferase [Acidobacteria bacterium]|nr:FkbM family methyltransferase [Acidobacteriota bacterium]
MNLLQLLKKCIPKQAKEILRRSEIINEILPPPPYETDVRLALQDLLKKGDIAFDVGANIGQHTGLMSRLVGASGEVHCFEPNPDCLPKLSRHLRLGNCRIIPKAVMDTSVNALDFYVDCREKMHGLASTVLTPEGKALDTKEVRRVGAISLDEYCSPTDRWPDLIKMDIEGAELMALRGAVRCIAAKSPHIILEYSSDGSAPSETPLKWLENRGYCVIDLDAYRRVDVERYAKTALFRNLLAVHKTKISGTPYGKPVVLTEIWSEQNPPMFRTRDFLLSPGRYIACLDFATHIRALIEIELSTRRAVLNRRGGWTDSFNWSSHLPFDVCARKRTRVRVRLAGETEKAALRRAALLRVDRKQEPL